MKTRFFALLAILFSFFMLKAAEIRDGHLYLSVNLKSAEKIELEISGGELKIRDGSGLFEKNYARDLSFSLPSMDANTVYRLIDPQANTGTDAAVRHYFSWEEGKLRQKEEHLYFFPHSFEHLSAAEDYALALGQPFKNIMPLDISKSGILIEDKQGSKEYFEAPLRLESATEIRIGEYYFSGEFELVHKNGKLHLNQILPLEGYIAGVLPNEIGPFSPLEALKAQAIAARTHAVSLLIYLRHKADGYDLCNSTHCQVYRGAHLFNQNIENAVMETAGEILVAEGRIADATYHSACGGKTDASSEIWKGAPVGHLSGSLCFAESANFDLSKEAEAQRWLNKRLSDTELSSWEKKALHWQRTISSFDLAKNLGLKSIKSLKVLKRGKSGRITRIAFMGDKEVVLDSEYQIRQAFGSLPSSFFYIKGSGADGAVKTGKNIELIGRGSGHGVGMCQLGALRRARQGESYQEIIANYYPETIITTDWMQNED